MKRYVSVFEMIARSSIYKVLLTIMGMVAIEAVLFYNTMTNPSGINFEEYIDQSYYSIVFRVAYTVITVWLILPGMNIGSTQSYTLQRLRIKESKIFWLQALYNAVVYVLLWGTQLMTILGSVIVYQKNLSEGAVMSNQTVFLAFYRNAFMHSILPLEDGPGWYVLGFIVITTALAAAEFTKLQRIGKFGFELCVIAFTTWIVFPRELGSDIAFFTLVTVTTYLVMIGRWGSHRLDAGGETS